jgi:hypothetical protein
MKKHIIRLGWVRRHGHMPVAEAITIVVRHACRGGRAPYEPACVCRDQRAGVGTLAAFVHRAIDCDCCARATCTTAGTPHRRLWCVRAGFTSRQARNSRSFGQHGFDEPIHHLFGPLTEERGIGEQRLVALAIQTCDVADEMLRRERTLITDTRILFARRSGIGCGTLTRMQIGAPTRNDAIGFARWKGEAISCRFAAYRHGAAVA